MNNRTVIIGLFVIVLAVAVAVAFLTPPQEAQAPVTNEEEPAAEVTSFEECVEAGYPVMESYPRQCNTPEGDHFVEDVGNAVEKVDLIQATNPSPNEKITSPLTVSGEARGYWFFEASFPYELRNEQNAVIAQGAIQATGEWMTEEFVPFTSQITFPAQPAGSKGTLILKKDNPSGMPENDDQLEIPVVF